MSTYTVINRDAHSIVQKLIREAVRSRMGLLTEATEKKEENGYKLTVTGDTVARVDFSTSAPAGKMLLNFAVKNAAGDLVNDADEVASSFNRETASQDFPSNSWIAWLKDSPAGTYSFIADFGTFDSASSRSTVEKTLAANLDLAATAVVAPVATPSVATNAPPANTPVAPAPEPQEPAMSIQDKIRTSAKAIQDDFDDVYTDGINLEVVKTNNAYDDHTWVDSSSGKSQFSLNDFSTGKGYNDAYTYFALVNNDSQKPIAFVVASDPKADGHFSTGRFIGPTSQRSSLKNAFCVLYHRATGEVHESCSDNGPGSENDKYGKGGGGGKSGGGGGGGGEDSKGTGGGSTRTGSKSLSTTTRGTQIIMGRGDAESRGFANYALERVSKGGRRFYSRSKSRYDAMGPGESLTPDILKLGQKENGLNPITLVVTFKKPVQIDPSKVIISKDGSQTISGQLTTLSPNRTADDIASIGFFYRQSAANLRELVRVGTPRSPGSSTKRLTAANDPTAFAAAAEWIFSHPEQFDLAEDVEFSSSGKAQEPGLRSSDSTGTGAIPAEQRGTTMSESVSRRSLLDLYRF